MNCTNSTKTLLNLRTAHPALLPNSAVLRLHTSDDARVFAYLRQSGDREVLVVLNLSGDDLNFNLEDERAHGDFKNSFSGAGVDFSDNRSLELKAWDYLVLTK